MSREQRIAAGAIIMQEEKILLVRYNDRHGRSYLVGPGGGMHSDDESITQALMREVKEETGLEVRSDVNSGHQTFHAASSPA
jgi:ADP-ribose pyrophosphatase YjhB (NUDIX family)